MQRLDADQIHSAIAQCVNLAAGNLEGARSGGRSLREGGAVRNALLAVALVLTVALHPESAGPAREIVTSLLAFAMGASFGGVAGGIKKIARRHEFRGRQFAGDIEHRLAFAHSEGLLVNVSFGKFPENILAGCGVIEKIFSSLQCAPWIPAGVNLKRRGAADHTIFL